MLPKDNAFPNTQNVLPYVIVGDGISIKKIFAEALSWFANLGDKSKEIFNYRLSRARRVSENAFGILSQKFQLYNRRLKLKPENADKIILTTCILHNYVRDHNINKEDCAFNYNTDSDTGLQNLPLQRGNVTNNAFTVRDTFKDFFMTKEGLVEWQDSTN